MNEKPKTAWWRLLRADGSDIGYKKRFPGETEREALSTFHARPGETITGMTEKERRQLHKDEREEAQRD